MNWQPIETVPRDVHEIIGYEDGVIAICHRKMFPRPIHPDGGDMLESRPGDRWKTFEDWDSAPGHSWSLAPTHWMPLPAAPEGLEEPHGHVYWEMRHQEAKDAVA